MMKSLADEWPKALKGLLIGAIVFLSILPSLGWIWHSVLPEHTHVFLNPISALTFQGKIEETEGPLHASPLYDPDACTACKVTQMRTGVVHIPSFDGIHVLGIAAAMHASTLSEQPPDYSTRLIFPQLMLLAPNLPLLDPPPKSS